MIMRTVKLAMTSMATAAPVTHHQTVQVVPKTEAMSVAKVMPVVEHRLQTNLDPPILATVEHRLQTNLDPPILATVEHRLQTNLDSPILATVEGHSDVKPRGALLSKGVQLGTYLIW
jgi:hypothetical protein